MSFLLSPHKPPFLLCFFLYCLKNGQFLPKVTTTEACAIPCMHGQDQAHCYCFVNSGDQLQLREDNCMPAPFWWNKGDRQIFLLLFSDCCAVMSFNLILILILNYWIYMLPLEGKFTPVK